MIQETLEKTKRLVWPEIEKYLKDPVYPKAFEIQDKYKKLQCFHWNLVKEYPERKGKYIRPTLVVLTAEAMGVKSQNITKTAAAMQVSEDWILVHDDFEDGSLERRGKPALNIIYGNELAVNGGDTLHIIMWKILNNQNNPAINEEFYRMLMRAALGQTVEIKWTQENKLDFNDKDWFFIADGKTAYYTIAGPMRLGAILAGATQKQLEDLAEFGVALGICFQLVDDILDLTTDFEGLKKQKGNDIFEGKRTLMLGHLLRNASKPDRNRIVKILSKNRDQKTQKEVDWIIDRMMYYGSTDHAQNIAKKYRDRARKIFDTKLSFLKHEPARTELKDLIDFILERKY
jgi:geranylgeranyl diphosphate synthase type II